MLLTKPKIDVMSLEVQCPYCPTIAWFSVGELRSQGWRYECTNLECGRTVHMKPVLSVQFEYDDGLEVLLSLSKKTQKTQSSQSPQPQKQVISPPKIKMYPGVIEGLLSIGYKHGEAKKRIDDYVRTSKFNGSENDLMVKLMQEKVV